jgi:hypothetical protein
MTEPEARACVSAINGHMNSARALLLSLYERRGWVALGYQSWRECATAEFDHAQRTLYQELEAARIEQRIAPLAQIGTIPERQLRPLSALTPMEQPIAWQEANERTNGKPTARDVTQVVDEMLHPEEWHAPMEDAQAADLRKMRANTGMFTSATPEWYTPSHIIDRVIALFGEIDLDPCSNAKGEAANVPALNHWTQEDDGLAQPWHGKVYMNPPYGDEIAPWVARMLNAYENEEIHEGVALLPARTDTAWFQPLLNYPICFVRGRLKFSGSENSAPFPSAIVYLGIDTELFRDWFGTVGNITMPIERAA